MFDCFKAPAPAPETKKPAVVPQETTGGTFGIVIGHNSKSRGAVNYFKESEWIFNQRIARKIQTLMAEKGYNVVILFRPPGWGYTAQCRHVADKALELGIKKVYCLHFNAAGSSSARGCEVLVVENAGEMLKRVADGITDDLNEKLGIRERRQDGIGFLKSGHNGFGMLNAMNGRGIAAALPEPCFANFKTKESMAIFENEDRYAGILADNAMKWLEGTLDPVD